jgi:hypothetical protein
VPSAAPEKGKIAAKVINHYGDEALKVYPVGRESQGTAAYPTAPGGYRQALHATDCSSPSSSGGWQRRLMRRMA